jgi:hypothetical protein
VPVARLKVLRVKSVCFEEDNGLFVQVNLVEDNDKLDPVGKRDCTPRPTPRTASMLAKTIEEGERRSERESHRTVHHERIILLLESVLFLLIVDFFDRSW